MIEQFQRIDVGANVKFSKLLFAEAIAALNEHRDDFKSGYADECIKRIEIILAFDELMFSPYTPQIVHEILGEMVGCNVLGKRIDAIGFDWYNKNTLAKNEGKIATIEKKDPAKKKKQTQAQFSKVVGKEGSIYGIIFHKELEKLFYLVIPQHEFCNRKNIDFTYGVNGDLGQWQPFCVSSMWELYNKEM